MKSRKLELLSPAANKQIAIEAIKHGADAVYIGPPSHGARKAAANSIADIEEVVDYAHQFRAKVYATVNTIVYDSEIKRVEALCRDLYHAGVDALIVQDMGILRMNIPPIALHASTQCDIRTPQKALFLQEAGFSQLVLARELTLAEIKDIANAVTIPLETFVHGALCVSYSGRCHASQTLFSRSANRGECAQICRLPYTLKDAEGNVLADRKFLLSLKDFNASHNIADLVDAGISSFKIEGRLKEMDYVKNITALYNIRLNEFITSHSGKYKRASFGEVELKFSPKADKSFNRGFTNYFLEKRGPEKISSMLTPKSQGEIITDTSQLNNGDGISFFDKSGQFSGVNINRIEGGKIIPSRNISLPKISKLFRTSDVKWNKLMAGETAVRKIRVDIEIDDKNVSAVDERGVRATIPLDLKYEIAQKPTDYSAVFSKLGNTIYTLKDFFSEMSSDRFYRLSEMTELRRKLISQLDFNNTKTYPRDLRRPENMEVKYPDEKLDYRDNVSNGLARLFYAQHGVKEIEESVETGRKLRPGDTVMTTRHCILRELDLCKKNNPKVNKLSEPLYLNYDGGHFRLDFDCKNCEMKVVMADGS